MIRSCQRWWSSTNAYSGNLKAVNFKIFANYEGMKGIHLKIKLWNVCIIMEKFILEVNSYVWKVASCSAYPWHIIFKANNTNSGLHYKAPSAHYALEILSSFVIYWMVTTYTLISWLQSFLNLPGCISDFWRRYTLMSLLVC